MNVGVPLCLWSRRQALERQECKSDRTDHAVGFVRLVWGQIVVAADGKSRTIALGGTDPTGKKFTSVGAYDKQQPTL
jgi:hypothetical protein